MIQQPHEREIASATQTLASLNHQAAVLRAELERLQRNLTDAQQGLNQARGVQLVQANEQLVLASLRADDIAQIAENKLREFTRARDALQDTPHRAMLLDQPRLRDLREANEQLVLAALVAQEHEEHATAAHRSQITFLAMVAHELRNPLTPILQAAELLHRPRTDDPRLERLQGVIKRQVAHMSRLIDDLLDGSRISTGKFRLERGSVDMTEVLNLAVETCQPAIDARLQHFDMQPLTERLPMHGDAVRLMQIFSNLLDNASKYTPNGGHIALAVEVLDQAMTITVSDDGIGITAEALPRIFDLFAQDPRALTLHSGGLGIGLAVVHELVQAHGGTVVGRSAGADLGSTFVVTLPMADQAASTSGA